MENELTRAIDKSKGISRVVNPENYIGSLNVLSNADKATNLAQGIGKFDKFANLMNGVASGVNAGLSVAGGISSIVGAVQNHKAAKKQQELANKQYNLELKKLQQQELNDNKLAATIDKSWGGSGKIANTLDYANHATEENTNGLNGFNQYNGYITSSSDNRMSGSGNILSINTPSTAIAPVGYSESLSNDDENTTFT